MHNHVSWHVPFLCNILLVLWLTSLAVAKDKPREKWPWYVCIMMKRSGNCKERINRFYYDTTTGMCTEFLYSGCGGNDNNFPTCKACDDFCSAGVICRQPKIVSDCDGKYERFFLNHTTRTCQNFTFSGCDMGLNNFKSMRGCERRCSQFLKPMPGVRRKGQNMCMVYRKRRAETKSSLGLSINFPRDPTFSFLMLLNLIAVKFILLLS